MISIIIVHYKVKKELFSCLDSIIASHPKTSYEIIVVDNDEMKTIESELKKKFPKVVPPRLKSSPLSKTTTLSPDNNSVRGTSFRVATQ